MKRKVVEIWMNRLSHAAVKQIEKSLGFHEELLISSGKFSHVRSDSLRQEGKFRRTATAEEALRLAARLMQTKGLLKAF